MNHWNMDNENPLGCVYVSVFFLQAQDPANN